MTKPIAIGLAAAVVALGAATLAMTQRSRAARIACFVGAIVLVGGALALLAWLAPATVAP